MRIALVKLSALGDIVQAMVVLQFIKNFNKKISIDWIVEEDFKDLLELNPDIDKVHVVRLRDAKKSKSILSFIEELKKIRNLDPYDLVVDLQGLIKSAVIARNVPSKITLGFDKFSARESFSSIFYSETFSFAYDKNIVERNIALISHALGFNISKENILNKVPFLYPNSKKIGFKPKNGKKNIVLISGASHESKCYPSEKFSEIVRQINANFYVSWGTNEEKNIAENIQRSTKNVVIIKKSSLDDLILLISQADLVIGSDTGPTHMAWALNIPSVTLFGSTPGYRNTYITKINKILESDSKVNPLNINKEDYSIKNIKSLDIVKLSKNLLNLKN